MTASGQRGVRVRGLRKSFRSLTRRHDVLLGIDLDLAPGEVVGLIGPNGAGKTTLMSCLLGFLHSDAGEVSLDGRAPDDLEIRRRTGFVPERMNFDRALTGWAFLRYMARLAGVPRQEVNARASALVDRFGLVDAADRRLSMYSRGMLQRLGMCQALIHEPDFIFLDEPTSGLDPNGVVLVREAIEEQKRRGAAVLLNSHQLAEVERVCDRVLFLSGGRVARAETLRHSGRLVVAIRLLPGTFDIVSVERIAEAPVSGDRVIVTVETERDVAALVQALVRSGAGVVGVTPHIADLERIFLEDA